MAYLIVWVGVMPVTPVARSCTSSKNRSKVSGSPLNLGAPFSVRVGINRVPIIAVERRGNGEGSGLGWRVGEDVDEFVTEETVVDRNDEGVMGDGAGVSVMKDSEDTDESVGDVRVVTGSEVKSIGEPDRESVRDEGGSSGVLDSVRGSGNESVSEDG